jgi:NTP pyrophosphatase (non-canonical NTP hydrolase)
MWNGILSPRKEYRALEPKLQRRVDLIASIAGELERAYRKHGTAQWGRHEFYAILKEEVDELWDAIKRDLPQEEVEKELLQVAAMCFRYFETRDRYREPEGTDSADRT